MFVVSIFFPPKQNREAIMSPASSPISGLIRRTCYLSAQLRPSHRLLTTRSRLSAPSPFASGPSPPRLSEDEQKVYEQLQRSSTGAFSTPNPGAIINQSPATSSSSSQQQPQINQSPQDAFSSTPVSEEEVAKVDARVVAQGEREELHPDVRRGALPEFEGEVNPQTGEVGPLRWGGEVDWSYNGRVTDF